METARKEHILHVAARAFARGGYRKTSIDEIARAAGVAKGTVYLACDSKEDLFFQVLHREVRDWVADGARHIDPRRRADDLLRDAVLPQMERLLERPLARDLLHGRYRDLMPGWEG